MGSFHLDHFHGVLVASILWRGGNIESFDNLRVVYSLSYKLQWVYTSSGEDERVIKSSDSSEGEAGSLMFSFGTSRVVMKTIQDQ